MAILMEQDRKPINWFGVVILILIVIFGGVAIYYLFFINTPFLEKVILPPALEETRRVKSVTIDVQSVVNDSVFQSLREHVGLPAVGVIGKTNPFVPF
jgi:hypothetical protein